MIYKIEPQRKVEEGTMVTKIMNENEIAYQIIGAALEVHKSLGPGLLESAYQECLFYKLKQLDFSVEKEKSMPLISKE